MHDSTFGITSSAPISVFAGSMEAKAVASKAPSASNKSFGAGTDGSKGEADGLH